jgi:hypothetical protein
LAGGSGAVTVGWQVAVSVQWVDSESVAVGWQVAVWRGGSGLTGGSVAVTVWQWVDR